MKNIKKRFGMFCVVFLSLLLFNSCEKLALYKDHKYTGPNVLDPQQGITAWEYLNLPRADTLFNQMKRAIAYAGLEEEYKKPDRTYLFMINAALGVRGSLGLGTESTTSYMGTKKVGTPAIAAKNWSDYPKAQIAEMLKYHIIQGRYTYDELPITDVDSRQPVIVTCKTLATQNADPLANNVYMNLSIGFAIQFNNFPKTGRTASARTGNLQMLDGCVVHVLGAYLEYKRLP